MTLPLTPKQEKLWRFIASCERSPSHDEMTAALGGKTRGAMTHETILALEAKGYVKRTPHLARSIIAIDPSVGLTSVLTSELLAELERRGILLGLRT
jgi:SOS-response transcriptional repressor LexA